MEDIPVVLFGDCLTLWCILVVYNENQTRALNTILLKCCLPSTDATNNSEYIRWTAQTMKFLIVEPSPLPILSQIFALGSCFQTPSPSVDSGKISQIRKELGSDWKLWLRPLLRWRGKWRWSLLALRRQLNKWKICVCMHRSYPPPLLSDRDVLRYVLRATAAQVLRGQHLT